MSTDKAGKDAERSLNCSAIDLFHNYLVLLFILHNKVLGENGRKKLDRFFSTLRPFTLVLSSECD